MQNVAVSGLASRRTPAARLRRLAGPLALAGAMLTTSVVQAAPKKDLDDPLLTADGRLRGYIEPGTAMDESSTVLTYFALVGLAIVSGAVMFKASRRTHLD